jgi:hypothetical protein
MKIRHDYTGDIATDNDANCFERRSECVARLVTLGVCGKTRGGGTGDESAPGTRLSVPRKDETFSGTV